MTLGQVSKTYKIPKTTLHDRVRGKYATDHIGAKTVLSADEEQRIANWVGHMSRVGYGRDMSCVRLSRRLSMTLAEKTLFSKTNRDGNGCVGFLSVIRICPSAQLSNQEWSGPSSLQRKFSVGLPNLNATLRMSSKMNAAA
ncbi:hypothetical protein DPMN_109663 [Dreissena polymorpha]|uniref:HTH psq-type domain-containing protein n=1 Tax=Dreissena polymorpha TaxID=45954 RepID=A0A9D4QM80_DREPO|nr:hypothetical protein DPMN_109663 [Dreissena polymorpha]